MYAPCQRCLGWRWDRCSSLTSTCTGRDCMNTPSSACRQSQPALSHPHLPHWHELSWLILLMVDKTACLRTIIHFSQQVLLCLQTVPIQHSSASRALPPLAYLSNSQQTVVLGLLEAEPLLLGPSSINLSNFLLQLYICLTSKYPIAIRQE